MKRKLTFKISSVKDYFDQILLPNFETYNANPLSFKEALSVAIFCWQFSDWIYNSCNDALMKQLKREKIVVNSLKEYQGVFIQMQCFSFISQIAIRAKHLECNDKRMQNVTSTLVETGFYQGLLGLGTATYLTINVGSGRYYFQRELKKYIDYWKVVLVQLDIL